MEIIDITFSNVKKPFGGALLLGTFDGVHLGHTSLVNEAKRISKEVGVLLFKNNPADIFDPSKKHYQITPLDDKIELFLSLGVSTIYIVDNDKEFFARSKEEFMSFLKRINPSYLVMGSDYTFGKGKEGKASDLKREFNVSVIELLTKNGSKIGSANIARCITEGKVEEASSYLGRVYEIEGEVVEGLHNGRKISFPTANLKLAKNYILPKRGVYKTVVHIDNKEYYGITNVGTNPTVGILNKPIVETYIGNFKEDLYGKTIKVGFLEYLRDEKKFETLEDLKAQLEKDKRTIEK